MLATQIQARLRDGQGHAITNFARALAGMLLLASIQPNR